METENQQKVDTSGVQAIVSLTDNGHACVREGYPLLLLRKSAINRTWLPSLSLASPPKLGDREPAEPLQDHLEILRVLREGYVYILAGTEAQKNYIGCYEVLEGGILREKLPDDFELDGKAPLPVRCVDDNHYVPASFISVDISNNTLKETPFLWIAYSRYAWNKNTRDYYKNAQGANLARFSKIDVASFIQSPSNHPRGISLTNENAFDNILEFMPYVSSKVQYLPNYKNWVEQKVHFTRFVQIRENQYSKPVGAIVLEDVLGMAEELNFQRLAEVNYTGDFKLHNKVDEKSFDIPYEYHELHTQQGQYKKLNYDLIEQYKIGTKQYFSENSKEGMVFISSIENICNFFKQETWQYGGKGEVLNDGSIIYRLPQAEKAHYDFDQYWAKLNAQLKMDQYNQFADVVKRYETIKKNNGRDYTLYCRWLFCEKLPASDFFSGRKKTLENKKEITFPEQNITSYNTIHFWQQEYDYQNQNIHNDILADAIAIFRTKGTSYYDMGLWDELLSGDKTYFYQVIAGNNASFWTESNFNTVAGKANDVASFFINEYVSNALLALANSQNITPEQTDKHLEKLTNASGIQENLAQGGHVNAKTRTITFRINNNKISALSNNKNISISTQSSISGTKQTSITLTLFCDDEGFKKIEDYIKRTNQGNRAANDTKKLATVIDENVSVKAGAGVNNPNLINEEFNITLPEERFKQLDAQLKTTHGSNFTGFEQIENKDGLISAKFKGRGTAESIKELKAYLQKYASSNTESRFASVKTLLTKITANHIDITINSSNLSDASQEMSNVIRESAPSTVTEHLPHQNGTPPPTNNSGKLKGPHAATSASMLFELLLLVWQAKLLRDNTQKLDELNLKPEERQEILYGILLASVSITINSIKVFTTSVKQLADMARAVESKAMVAITNKATALSEKALMRVLIGSVGKIDYIAKAWGVLEGFKELTFGIVKVTRGFYSSGLWQSASGILLAASMLFNASGVGITLSIVCVALSIFCMYMSESTMLTVMEQWFDRCYFGKNELTDNLSRYPLTEEGVKKLIYGFYGASRGYALFLTKKSQNSFIIDYGNQYGIYLNLILPAYNPQSINYYGSLIVEKREGGKKILIGHTLSQNTLSTTTLHDDISETLTPLEMKVDFTMQNPSTADTQQRLVNSEQTAPLNEQGALIVCQKLYIADNNIDKKISILGYIDEQDTDDSSFVIELADYIDI